MWRFNFASVLSRLRYFLREEKRVYGNVVVVSMVTKFAGRKNSLHRKRNTRRPGCTLYRYFVAVLVKLPSLSDTTGLTYLQDGRGYGRVNTSGVFTGL